MTAKQKRMVLIVFWLCTAITYGLGGLVATGESYEQLFELPQLHTPQDMSSPEYESYMTKHKIYLKIVGKGVALWVLMGSLFGIFLGLGFIRGVELHPAVRMPPLGCFVAVVGSLIGTGLALWVLPSFQVEEIAVVRPTLTRVLLSGPTGAASVIPTMFVAGRIIIRIAEKKQR